MTKLAGPFTIITGKKLDLPTRDSSSPMAPSDWEAWNSSTQSYDGTTGMIATGRNGGAWNGSQIITSMTAAVGANALTTLGVAKAGDISKTTFGGLPVTSNDVLVMYTYTGDANLSGAVDGRRLFPNRCRLRFARVNERFRERRFQLRREDQRG